MGNASGLEALPGFAGVSASIVLSNLGAGFGMAKSGAGIAGMGQRKPLLIIKCLLPVVMASILGIYGMIVSVVLLKSIDMQSYTWEQGYRHLAAGLCCGGSCVAAGLTIGIVGDIAVRKIAKQERLFAGMLLILIFAEAIALYGMILGIMVASRK